MKILMVGAWTGWMGLHLRHFAKGFAGCGAEVIPADYHRMERFAGVIPVPENSEDELRQRALEKAVRKNNPDLILFAASWKFDMARVRSYYSGAAAVYDYDGPRRAEIPDFTRFKPDNIDIFTVSRFWQRELAAAGIPSEYLPHGVDCSYYARVHDVPAQYTSRVSYIGRATDRRVEFCDAISDSGLALFGKRWEHHRNARNLKAHNCIRLKRDVGGYELVKIYSGSDMMINILQEPLNEFHTILSLQCFAIPAAGACLAAEYVEEMDEAFDIGREILTFRTADELREITARCLREPDFARAAGAAGRARCLACHTHRHRAEELLKFYS